MSYILTALKKSEAERAKGAVPRLTVQQAPRPGRRRAVWPWIVGAALVANAAVVVLAWGPGISNLTGGRTNVDAPVVTVAPPVPDAAVTAAAPPAATNGAKPPRSVTPRPQPRAQPAAREPEPPDVPAPIAETATGPRQSAPPGPVAQPQAAPPPPTRAQTRTQTAVARYGAANDLDQRPIPRASLTDPAASQPPPAAPEAETVPRPPRRPVGALSLPRTGLSDPVPLDSGARPPAAGGPELALAAPALSEVTPEAPAEPDPYASVPMLWQLPSVIRTKLPKLSMSVHVYAPEKPGRFIIVDRRKYREGDTLAGGARLVAIVPGGIVLDHQGQRYRIGN